MSEFSSIRISRAPKSFDSNFIRIMKALVYVPWHSTQTGSQDLLLRTSYWGDIVIIGLRFIPIRFNLNVVERWQASCYHCSARANFYWTLRFVRQNTIFGPFQIRRFLNTSTNCYYCNHAKSTGNKSCLLSITNALLPKADDYNTYFITFLFLSFPASSCRVWLSASRIIWSNQLKSRIYFHWFLYRIRLGYVSWNIS